MSGIYLFGYTPYDFGTVPVGTPLTANIPMQSSSGFGTAVTMGGVVSGPDAARFVFNSITPTTFNPDVMGSTSVTFTPNGAGPFNATLTISSDAINAPTVIALTGRGGSVGSLTLTPQTTNDFGSVLDGTTSPVLNVLAENNSGTNVTVTAIAFSSTTGPITAASINAGGSGYANGDTGSIDGDSGDAQYVVTGVDGSGGVLSFDVSNPGTDYVATTGFATTPITGVGTGFVINIGSVRTGEFAAGPGQPGLPFTLLANGGSAPVVIPVVFTPTVTGFVQDMHAVVVTSSATNSPTSQTMQGTGVPFFPAYIVSSVPLAVLVAFTLAGTPTILRVNPDDLNCEESASFKRIYDWGAALLEKYLGRIILRYEDESATPFNLTATCIAPRSPSPVTTSVIGKGGNNDALIRNLFFDIQISADLVQVEISRAANDGPVQITEMFHEVDIRGEVVENV